MAFASSTQTCDLWGLGTALKMDHYLGVQPSQYLGQIHRSRVVLQTFWEYVCHIYTYIYIHIYIYVIICIYIWSRSKTHARLLVSEWHLQIWMCVFAAVAKDRERAAKGSRKVLSTTIYKHICYSIHAWQFSLQNCHRIHAWDCTLHLYNTLTDICIERCRHLLFFVDGYERVSVSYCPMFLHWQRHPD